MKEKNTTDRNIEIDDRRIILSQCRLVNSGKGLILFGVWSLIKTISYMIYDPADFKALIWEVVDTRAEFYTTYIAAVAFLALIDLVPRILTGLAAIHEGKSVWKPNRKNGKAVLILNIYMLLFCTASFLGTFFTETEEIMPYLDQVIIGIAVDLMSLGITIEMLVSLLSLRRLLKNRKEGGV